MPSTKRKASTTKASPKAKLQRSTTLAAVVAKEEPTLRPVHRTKKAASPKPAAAKKSTPKTASKTSLSLFYWDGRGLMEITRQLLVHAGQKPGEDFTDNRYADFNMNTAEVVGKPLGDNWHWNCGRMPVIEHNGHVIGQSQPIYRYVARECGLMGSNAVEAAQIDSILANLTDLQESFYKLLPYGNTFSDDEKAKKTTEFITAPAPTEGRDGRYLKWYLAHLEAVVGKKGFAVGNAASLADAALFNKLGDVASHLGAKGEPFGSLKEVNDTLKSFPNIQKIVKTWGSNKNVAAWLKSRPAGLF